MVMIVAMMSELFMNQARNLLYHELSPVKLITYLIGKDRLSQAVHNYRVEELLEEISGTMQRRFLKNKRELKTMRERISLFEPYYECEACA